MGCGDKKNYVKNEIIQSALGFIGIYGGEAIDA